MGVIAYEYTHGTESPQIKRDVLCAHAYWYTNAKCSIKYRHIQTHLIVVNFTWCIIVTWLITLEYLVTQIHVFNYYVETVSHISRYPFYQNEYAWLYYFKVMGYICTIKATYNSSNEQYVSSKLLICQCVVRRVHLHWLNWQGNIKNNIVAR